MGNNLLFLEAQDVLIFLGEGFRKKKKQNKTNKKKKKKKKNDEQKTKKIETERTAPWSANNTSPRKQSAIAVFSEAFFPIFLLFVLLDSWIKKTKKTFRNYKRRTPAPKKGQFIDFQKLEQHISIRKKFKSQ